MMMNGSASDAKVCQLMVTQRFPQKPEDFPAHRQRCYH
jgi:hypothetical protein